MVTFVSGTGMYACQREREREREHTQGRWPCHNPFSSILFFGEVFCYRVHVFARKTERDRETESEKSLPRGDGHAAIPTPPFSSQDLGHACTRTQREFKPPGPGFEPWSTTWESSGVAIMLSAGPIIFCIICIDRFQFGTRMCTLTHVHTLSHR